MKKSKHLLVRYVAIGLFAMAWISPPPVRAEEGDAPARTPAKTAGSSAAATRPAAPAIDWEFDENRGSALTDSGDSKINGKLIGSPQWVTGRKTGAVALRFDGKTDSIELSSPLPDAETMSVEAWIKLDEDASGMNTILCDADAAPESDWWIAVEPEAVVICASKNEKPLGDGRTNGNQSFERVLLDQDIRGKWVHLVWTMDDAQSVVYLDGKPAGMIAKGGCNVGNHSGHPTIGRFSIDGPKDSAKKQRSTPNPRFFKGMIDSLRLYPDALTEAQVAELFSGPARPPTIARKRRAVPPAQALETATNTIRETFKGEYANKAPDARRILGDHLMQAADTETDLAMQFALLREARDAYAGAGEVERSLQTASSMAEQFILSAAEVKLDALSIAVKSVSLADSGKPIAQAALGAANVLVSAGKYTLSLKALSVAETAARGAKDSPLESLVRDRSKEVKDIQMQWQKVEASAAALELKPDDADANLRVGRFYCMVAGNWERGLPLLARGADAKLKALATKELAAPTDAQGRIAVGNGWWDYAPSVVPPSAAPAVKAHAASWYDLALPDLDDATATRLRARINEIQSGSKVNVLVLADPKSDWKRGKWKMGRGQLGGDNSDYAQYQFPYEPPEEYDLRAVFTPISGDDQTAILFPTSAGALAVSFLNDAATFEDPANLLFRGKGGGRHDRGGPGGGGGGGGDAITHRLPRNTLAAGRPLTVVIKVRNDGILVFLNNEQIFKFDADNPDLRPSRAWRLDDAKAIGIGANDTEILVQSVEVLEVRGKGAIVKRAVEPAAN